MRTLLFISSLIVSLSYGTPVQAAPNLLLQCLAKEESLLHKEKSQGVLYRLNQEFLNELATSNDIALKKNFVDEICNSKKHSPSVGLLRLLLLKESDIYDLSLSEVDPTMRPFKMGYINEFQKQVPRFFIQYISGLQSEMATSDCLAKAIPEIAVFNERLKYLEEEMSTHEVLRDKSRIDKIFTKLQNINSIKENCDRLAAGRSRRKVKKKESTNF
ncbi:MAG: hypothetical protein H7281_19595 [Bacteriovorax sp.]|nr:hypothetical protein [Bacteriovorax sp.]